MVIQTTLFISVALTDFIYTSYFDYFLFIPVIILTLFIPVIILALFIPVIIVYISHQCPRGGERLAG